jgi:hypothetical protein
MANDPTLTLSEIRALIGFHADACSRSVDEWNHSLGLTTESDRADELETEASRLLAIVRLLKKRIEEQ